MATNDTGESTSSRRRRRSEPYWSIRAFSALGLAATAFVPMIDWFGGTGLIAKRLSMVEVVWMYGSHRIEPAFGPALLLLPALIAAVFVVRGLGTHASRFVTVAVVIAALEMVFSMVHSRSFGGLRAIPEFLGIDAMVPSKRFIPHAAASLVLALVWMFGEWAAAGEPEERD